MTECKHKRKKKNILKGYFWCDGCKRVRKDKGRCSCWCYHYEPKFPYSLFRWVKELFSYG